MKTILVMIDFYESCDKKASIRYGNDYAVTLCMNYNVMEHHRANRGFAIKNKKRLDGQDPMPSGSRVFAEL